MSASFAPISAKHVLLSARNTLPTWITVGSAPKPAADVPRLAGKWHKGRTLWQPDQHLLHQKARKRIVSRAF